MERRPLEVTVISATDLEDVRTVLKMHPYVVASLWNDQGRIEGRRRTPALTPALKKGGTSPCWNHAFVPPFTVDVAAALDGRVTLKLEIKTERTVKSNKLVGCVDVPVGELLEQGDDGNRKEMSYAVRRRGVLKFSYKFGEAFIVHGAAPDQQQENQQPRRGGGGWFRGAMFGAALPDMMPNDDDDDSDM